MKIQISNGIFMALVINMMYAKSIGMTQGTVAREIGSDMWIATTFSFLQGIFIMLLTIYAIKQLPNKNMIKQGESIIGKGFGRIIAFVIFLFFFFAFPGVLATFVFHLKDFFLPDAPTLLFVVVALILAIYALYFGLEVIGRMALIGVFSILALNILIVFGTIDLFDMNNLFPLFLSGPVEPFIASRHLSTDWSLSTMMAAMILPYVKDTKTWMKSGITAMIIAGLVIVIWPVLEAGVLSSEVTAQYYVACMQLARNAHIGYFLQRYEMIMIAFFALSSLTQIMMSIFCASVAAQQMLGMKDYRKIILPVALGIGAYGYYMVLDHHRAMTYLENEWVYISLSIALVLPLLFLLIGLLRKGKYKQKRQESF